MWDVYKDAIRQRTGRGKTKNTPPFTCSLTNQSKKIYNKYSLSRFFPPFCPLHSLFLSLLIWQWRTLQEADQEDPISRDRYLHLLDASALPRSPLLQLSILAPLIFLSDPLRPLVLSYTAVSRPLRHRPYGFQSNARHLLDDRFRCRRGTKWWGSRALGAVIRSGRAYVPLRRIRARFVVVCTRTRTPAPAPAPEARTSRIGWMLGDRRWRTRWWGLGEWKGTWWRERCRRWFGRRHINSGGERRLSRDLVGYRSCPWPVPTIFERRRPFFFFKFCIEFLWEVFQRRRGSELPVQSDSLGWLNT